MNIEEFVNDYLQEHRHDVLLSPYNGLIDFANAFKEQMLKEAVEGMVYDFRRIKEIGYSSAKIEFDKIPELDDGDKVHIIIVKED